MADAAATVHLLKLVVDPNLRRVLYAEASGEAIEFLHSLLVSPHVRLPFDAATLNASIANVYDSVEKLRASCTVQRQEEEEHFFVCGIGNGGASCGGYVTDKSGARCPSCGGEMAVEVPLGSPGASCSNPGAAGGRGGMKGPNLTCLPMDVLTVIPAGGALALASSFMMGTSFMMGLVPHGTLLEVVVCLGYMEAMEILERSLKSSSVLTDVFLCKKKSRRRFGKSAQLSAWY